VHTHAYMTISHSCFENLTAWMYLSVAGWNTRCYSHDAAVAATTALMHARDLVCKVTSLPIVVVSNVVERSNNT